VIDSVANQMQGNLNRPTQHKSFLLLCLSLSISLSLVVRLPYFFTSDFVLNDGALFVQMAEAIRQNHYALPEAVRYNQINLPFAYPPLAFYLVAFLTDAFRLDILEVVRYLPFVFNLLCVGIFILLAARLIQNKVILLYTSLFFPLIPRSYEWLIMGGGVTRSVGFFFALLAMYQSTRLLKRDLPSFGYSSLFLSMAALSHLEWGITAMVTVLLLILSREFNQRGLLLSLALGAVVLVATSPWWITILRWHGLEPFMAASKTSQWNLANLLLFFKIFDDGLGLPLSLLAIIGWFSCVAKRNWFLPLWLIVIFVTTPRHGPTAAAMPLAILAAVGLVQFLMPFLLRTTPSTMGWLTGGVGSSHSRQPRSLRQQRLHSLIFPGVAVLCLLILTRTVYATRTPLVALTDSERAAMSWIKKNTPAASKFIVLSSSASWEDDRAAEWFPVLSDRKSLTTAQGLEWLPGQVFHTKVEQIEQLKRQQALGGTGLARYLESHFGSFQYVAVFIRGYDRTSGQFLQSRRYQVVYSNDAVLVLARLKSESDSQALPTVL